jgi:gas vesicle protein
MQEADMQRALSFLAGAISGAVVGATLMVLFTPASGETIRSDVRKRVQGLRDQMSEAAAARRAELQAQLAGLRAPRG